jgi:hypothetical protein
MVCGAILFRKVTIMSPLQGFCALYFSKYLYQNTTPLGFQEPHRGDILVAKDYKITKHQAPEGRYNIATIIYLK